LEDYGGYGFVPLPHFLLPSASLGSAFFVSQKNDYPILHPPPTQKKGVLHPLFFLSICAFSHRIKKNIRVDVLFRFRCGWVYYDLQPPYHSKTNLPYFIKIGGV
jgi:hypothetical protein